MSALAKRYARAAFEAVAAGAGSADAVAAELQQFAGLLEASPALREALVSPALQVQRPALLDALGQRLGCGPLTTRLLKLVAANRRVDQLGAIAAELTALTDAAAGRLRATARVSVAPSEAQVARLAAALTARLGQPVAVSVQLDASLLGGMVVQVGDLTLDSSLKRQLEILTERLGTQAP